jgi:hypothetical protein
MFQSREEIYRVFADWSVNFAPKNLIQNDRNAQLLSNYVLDRGVVSVGALNDAIAALGNQLDYTPAPRQKTQAELARDFDAKERARIKREAAENIAKSKEFDNLALPAASSIELKRQADAQKAVDALVARFSVNGSTPGTFDSRKTEAGRAALRAIKITSNGKYDAVLTLKIVGAAFHHDSVAEIRAAAQRELDSWTNKDENLRRKSEESKLGVGPGNLPRYQ